LALVSTQTWRTRSSCWSRGEIDMQRPGHGHRLLHGLGHEQVAGRNLGQDAVGHAQQGGEGVDADIDDQFGPEQASPSSAIRVSMPARLNSPAMAAIFSA
jgi:hypothetical protein